MCRSFVNAFPRVGAVPGFTGHPDPHPPVHPHPSLPPSRGKGSSTLTHRPSGVGGQAGAHAGRRYARARFLPPQERRAASPRRFTPILASPHQGEGIKHPHPPPLRSWGAGRRSRGTPLRPGEVPASAGTTGCLAPTVHPHPSLPPSRGKGSNTPSCPSCASMLVDRRAAPPARQRPGLTDKPDFHERRCNPEER